MARIPHDPVPIEVVALVASTARVPALLAILRELPADLVAAVVVQHHPVHEAGALAPLLADPLALTIGWAGDGARVEGGHILVGPPRQGLEALPDRTWALAPVDPDAGDRPLDHLLTSLADWYGPRALAVVLADTGEDGGEGIHALTRAGGTVIVADDAVTGSGPGPSPVSLARTVSGLAAGKAAESVKHLSSGLRTPLTLVVGSLEQALRRDDLPPDLRQELAASVHRLHRLQSLMDTLLDLSASEHERLVHIAATDAYRVALTDALRALNDPAEIQAVASAMLADHLDVSRAYYVGPLEGGLVRVQQDVHRGLPSVAGVYRVADYGDDIIDGLVSNKTFVATDIRDLDLGESVKAAWDAVSTVSLIAVPLVRDGEWLGTLTVAHHAPRRWTDAEIALVEETAERTWAAVERARAEAALREAQAELRRYNSPNN
jgi:hypothetical protein